VRREELLSFGNRLMPVSYGSRRIAQVTKETRIAAAETHAEQLVELRHGKGRILWCPLPLELNDRIEPISAVYRYALESSGCSEELHWIKGGHLPGVYGRKLSFNDGALFTFVSEFSLDVEIEVKDPATGVRYAFMLEKERSVLFAADNKGQLLSVYRPDQVSITLMPANDD
jgi:hypothetical protein